jgi:hypothetical protein
MELIAFILCKQGKWTAKKIPNPDYFEDKTPYKMTTIVSLS